MLHVRHEKFVRVDVLTYAEKLVAMQVHVRHFLVVAGKEAPVGEDKLKAVVE